ncbi:MAG TPA: hypothetical protein VK971_03560 [Thiohalobacter sp.]|nr:hypothetical protein [Thiohalobacter sp.]
MIPDALRPGRTVSTSYGSGPYRIVEVSGPCTCPSYMDTLELGEAAPPSAPHFHLTCRRADGCKPKGPYYLNGYRADGTCVWSQDRLIFHGQASDPMASRPTPLYHSYWGDIGI